jgi:S1-C subfamily serine protease
MPLAPRSIPFRARAALFPVIAALGVIVCAATGASAIPAPKRPTVVATTHSSGAKATELATTSTLPVPPKGLVIGPNDVAPIVANDTLVNNQANSSLSIPQQDAHETCIQGVIDDATFRGERAAGASTLGGSFTQVSSRAMVPRTSSYPAWFSVLAADHASGQPTTNTVLTYSKSSATSKWKLAISAEVLGPTVAGASVPATSTDSGGFVSSLSASNTDGLVLAPNKVAARVASAFSTEAASGKLPSGVTAQFGPKGAADPHLLVTSYSAAGSATLQATATPPAGANVGSLARTCPYPAIRLANGGALVSFVIYFKVAIHVRAGSVIVQPTDRSALGALLAPGAYSSASMVMADMGLAVVPKAGSTAPIAMIGQASGVLGETGVTGSGSPSSGSSGGPANAAAIAKSVDGAIVDITATLGNEHAEVAGTGMVISANGEILTNNHVIQNATSITATDIGNGKSYSAKVLGYDRTRDVAVLQLAGAQNLATVKTADSSAVKINDGVVGVGNAGGRGGTPSYAGGRILALNQSINAASEADGTSEQLTGLFETNAQIQPGDSGGPLVNSSGKVIGIDAAASAGFSFQQGGAAATDGFAIPIATALDISKTVLSGQSSTTVHVGPTAFLGVGVAPQRSSSGFGGGIAGTPSGAQIASVVSGSPASSAHLAVGDTIISIGGHTVASSSALTTVMTSEKPGASVRVVYIDQSGNQKSTSVRLAQGPPQ